MTNPVAQLAADHPETHQQMGRLLDGLIRAGELYLTADRPRFRSSCQRGDVKEMKHVFSKLEREFAVGVEILSPGLEDSAFKSAQEIYGEIRKGRRSTSDLPDAVMLAAADLQDQFTEGYLQMMAEHLPELSSRSATTGDTRGQIPQLLSHIHLP